MKLGYYKVDRNAPDLIFATKESACFDLSFNPGDSAAVTGYAPSNAKITRLLNHERVLDVMPGERLLVPTGLILDIPTGYSVRVHARSGMALKQGIILANSEGVIDSDYVEMLYIMVLNISTNKISIRPGDRIAQAEMIPVLSYSTEEVMLRPSVRTDRIGGLGSTGITSEAPVKRGPGRPRKDAVQKKVAEPEPSVIYINNN